MLAIGIFVNVLCQFGDLPLTFIFRLFFYTFIFRLFFYEYVLNFVRNLLRGLYSLCSLIPFSLSFSLPSFLPPSLPPSFPPFLPSLLYFLQLSSCLRKNNKLLSYYFTFAGKDFFSCT